MWVSVVLIILVIVVGLIAGSRLSAPGPQRRAVNAAFISLAVMAGLFFILINAFPGDWIVPFFTVACIVVPICIYMGFTRAAVKAQKAANKKAFEIPRAVMKWTDEDVSSDEPVKATTAAPVAEAKPKAEAKAKAAKPAKAAAPTPTPAPEKITEKAKEKPTAQAVKQTAEAKPEKAAPKAEAKTESKAELKTSRAAEPTKAAKPEKPAEENAKKAAPVQDKKPAAKATSAASEKAPITKAAKPAAPKIAKDIQASLTAKGAEGEPIKEPAPHFTAAASAELLTGRASQTDEASAHKSLINEIEALVERDLNIGRKIAEGASDEEVRAAESAPFSYKDSHLPSSLQKPEPTEPEAPATLATPEHETAPSVEAAPATAAAPTPEPAPAPAPIPEPKPEPKPEPLDPFTEFCNKANTLRDQGSYAVAAVIFSKAADVASSVAEARAAQFDELSCYVKAGETAKAKALAAKLRQSSVLTRFERIKLDAVERMG